MNLRPRRAEEPEINMVSLIDVVLMLVIFFMLSANFAGEGRMRIRLPQASSVPVERAATAALVVSVTERGSYLVNGRELVNASADTLRAAIERVAPAERNGPVSLKADGRATHQAVVTAMDVLGQLGFAQLNFVTTNDTGTRAP
ncbi:MAG: biopolymer transporter ExbD [Steroidobacteraceae bacterium]